MSPDSRCWVAFIFCVGKSWVRCTHTLSVHAHTDARTRAFTPGSYKTAHFTDSEHLKTQQKTEYKQTLLKNAFDEVVGCAFI